MDIAINYLAVAIAGVVSFAVGWVWYSPLVFGNLWMKGANIDSSAMEAGKKQMPLMTGIALVSQLIAAYVIAHFISLLEITDIASALEFAFWGWLGFAAVPLLGSVLWERKSIAYYTITAGYWLVGFSLTSGILIWWA